MSRRSERDSYSATSSTSKMSAAERRNPKPPRFSLRRFFCRRPSARSVMSTKSANAAPAAPIPAATAAASTEVESRSVVSFQISQERESAHSTHNVSLAEESSAHSLHSNASTIQSARSKRSRDVIECPLCLQPQSRDNFPAIMTCHHRSCRDCLRQYLKIEITESRVNIACPECAERFHPNDIRAILEDEALWSKFEEFMIRRVLVLDPDTRWCPAPDCGYAVIAAGCASCPKLKCERPGCDTHFCYHCKQHWHPNQTCDAARARRSTNMRSSSLSYSHDSGDDIKPCPRCGAFIVKMDDGSCNHMTCAVCGAEFCWLCMKEISDLHYLSPSGCTFWGKKPWSRKKKILWQLGTLVGAPVGIALVAGIAVPAMIIGIPVWVGRKLYTKYETSPRHRRNLIIAGGVTAAIIISPVLAGLAVGIGVPILLAYVYGVVPISLCRAGGCGVTTTNSGGVRFEFDDETDVAAVATGPYAEVASNEQHGHILNPSIGPSIGEMSMGMTNSLSASGSHMERLGTLHAGEHADRESASHRAIAGESLTGSLSGSTLGGATGFHNSHRVDIQADVATNQNAPNKRASLSSESANLSLDAKSATISFQGDNVSTKGLAGSLCTRDKDNNSAIVPPLEMQQMDSTSTGHSHPAPASHEPTRCQVVEGQSEGQVGVKGHSRQGSPTSSRSVSFLCDEMPETNSSTRKKKFKLQSVSVGDCIHEQSSSPAPAPAHMSVRSLTSEDSRLDLAPPHAKPPPISPSQIKGHFRLQPCSETASLAGVCIQKPRSYSTDSVLSGRSSDEGTQGGLTQVESDRLRNSESDRRGRSLLLSDSSSDRGSFLSNKTRGLSSRDAGDDVVVINIDHDSNHGDSSDDHAHSDTASRRHGSVAKQQTVYFRTSSNDPMEGAAIHSAVRNVDTSVAMDSAVSAGAQGALAGAIGDTGVRTSMDGLSDRSNSSSDTSTCGLLRSHHE